MVQAEAVKEGCSIYNRSESCPGKLSLHEGRGVRSPEPQSLRKWTASTNCWLLIQEHLYHAPAGILAYNLVQCAQELAVASTSSGEEVFGMAGSS